MRFKYIGDGNEPPRRTVVYGHAFELDGPAVEVSDEQVIAKLKGMRTFEVAKGRPPASEGNEGK